MITQLRVNSTGLARTEQYLGRTWTVVPVVALVEGVVHAANAEDPELVQAEAFTKYPEGWDGRPVFVGHPQIDGEYVGGNTPAVLETLAVGQVFNAGIKKGKLAMEAWLDNERAAAVPSLARLLERIAANEPIEISVGAFVETDGAAGEYEGMKYASAWVSITPDHLALLPEDQVGACSRKAGCGVRAASAKGAGMSEPKKQGILSRILGALRTAQSPEEMSDNDVRRKLHDALKAGGVSGCYVEAVYDDAVVYAAYGDYGMSKYYRRGYALGEGGVTLTGDAVEVEPVLSYEPVGGGDDDDAKPTSLTTATGAPCKCREHQPETLQENKSMTRDELLNKLANVGDAQIEAFVASLETPAAPPAPVAPEAPTVAAAAPTFETLLAAAPAEVRESIQAGVRVAAERKATTIKALKDSGKCDLPDAVLNAMPQAQLDALTKLAGIGPAVDFSALGAARTPEAPVTAAPAAPSLQDRILAARK